MSLTLAYLARIDYALPTNSTTLARQFFAAYDQFPAGIPHDLVVVIKSTLGLGSQVPLTPRTQFIALMAAEIKDLAVARGASVHYHPDLGFDLGSYRRVAETVATGHCCFLNSYSRPRSADWLRKLYEPHLQPDVALTGATGSMEVRRHIRTNAFCMLRERYLSTVRTEPNSKQECQALEHGPHSLTMQIEKAGLRTLVVGDHGTFPIETLADQRVYRSSGQEALLVADNQTDRYQTGAVAYRTLLRVEAWGRP